MNKTPLLTSATIKSPLVIGLFTVIFFLLFSFTLSNAMSPYIASELGAGHDIATYTVSFFGVGAAIGVPLGTPLSKRIGVAKFMTACLLLFAFCSWVCSSAPNYPVFILARFFQGFVSGPVYILIVYVFRLLSEKQKLVCTAVSIAMFTTVPALSTAWGGWLAYDYHWTWAFVIETWLLLILAVFMWLEMRKYAFPQEKVPFDGVGYFFFAIGILCFGTIITMGQELDWYRSNFVIALTIIGTPCLLFFLLWDWRHPHPILKLQLFKHKTFLFCMFYLASLFGAYFGTIILIAQWLILDVTYTPIWIAWLLIIMAVTGGFPVFMIRHKFRSLTFLDTRMNLSIAIFLLALSGLLSMFFNEFVNFGRIAITRLIAGFGLAFFLPPLFRLAFNSFPEEERFHVMTLFQVFRALGSGLAVAFYTTLWQRRKVFFHERLGGDLTPFSQVTDEYFVNASEFQLQGDHALAQLNKFLDLRSSALGLEDVFYFMTLAISSLLLLILLTYLFRWQGFIPEQSEKSASSLNDHN